MNTLQQLFDKYKCDKGSLKHRYDRVYEPHLKEIQIYQFRMLEIGVFKGNSTEAFVDFCPNASFVGIDIFERVEMKDIPILQHPRVTGFQCDSLLPPRKKFDSIAGDGFDVIIDDGLHTHEAQWKTFQNFFPYLKTGGSYFIEDVWPYHIMSEQEKQHYWLKRHDGFSEEWYKKLSAIIRPYHVKHHDLRTGYDPDTYIIEVIK